MAVIGAGTVEWQRTEAGVREAVISLRKVTAGDTIDVSTVPQVGLFTSVFSAAFHSSTNRTATPTEAGIAGTVLTLAGAGLAGDGGLLVVIGEY